VRRILAEKFEELVRIDLKSRRGSSYSESTLNPHSALQYAFDRVYEEIDELKVEMNQRFTTLETGMNQRFDSLDAKFDLIMRQITGK
jgi:hypothetical protein